MKKHFKPFLGLLIVILIAIGGFIVLNLLSEEVPAQEIEIEEEGKEQPHALEITPHQDVHKFDKQLKGVEGGTKEGSSGGNYPEGGAAIAE